MVGLQGRYEYFDTYRRIDIALDPFPYPGGTTTCDALWMGVPTVTLNGRWALWRAGVNILSYMDLQELIADTTADYQRIAFELAHHWPRLAHLRATLRQRMQNSPLMDADGCARALEAAYGEMWRRWCAT
jgi:predicted O-linked N-acetylglucosamine transferase (SPINDLY family)